MGVGEGVYEGREGVGVCVGVGVDGRHDNGRFSLPS